MASLDGNKREEKLKSLRTEAAFKFFADNPPAILCAGAVLLFIFGSLAHMIGAIAVAYALYTLGLLCLLVGAVLQIQWLKTRR